MVIVTEHKGLTAALFYKQLDHCICHKLAGLSPVRILACLGGGNEGFNDGLYAAIALLLRIHERHAGIEQIAQIQPWLGGGGLAASGCAHQAT
jgi:uncharacterized protein (DUF2235 family)